MSAHNRRVRQEFADIEVDDDINTPRSSLKVACLIKDSDSAPMALLRLLLYYDIIKENDAATVGYNVPFQSVIEQVRGRPQVCLKFIQRYTDLPDGESPVVSELSFRLMDETSQSMTPAKAEALARKIKTLFGTGTGFRWARGKDMFTYSDAKRGYFLQLLVQSRSEGRRIVEQVLDIQGHTPDWKNANYKENEEKTEAYPNTPPTEVIYGRSRRLPKRRPVCTLTFRVAFLHIDGLPNPIVLLDGSGYYRTALENF